MVKMSSLPQTGVDGLAGGSLGVDGFDGAVVTTGAEGLAVGSVGVVLVVGLLGVVLGVALGVVLGVALGLALGAALGAAGCPLSTVIFAPLEASLPPSASVNRHTALQPFSSAGTL